MQNQMAMEEMMKEVASQQILQAVKMQEEALDQKLKEMDNMDEDDYEVIRQKRLAQMKKQAEKKREWLSNGHGRYMEIPDQAEFFNATKRSDRLIVHFYRPTTRYCEIVDAHFEKLCQKHVETRFVKINAEKSPYLVEKLNIFMMPTLVLIKDNQTVHHIRGFDEFGGQDDFSTEIMAYILGSYKVINHDGTVPDFSGVGKGVNSISMTRGAAIREGANEREYDSDEDSDC